MASTERCVVCLGKAVTFHGHVHIGNEIITAGFCEDHSDFYKKLGRIDCERCFGEWSEDMGVNSKYGQIGFIGDEGFKSLEK